MGHHRRSLQIYLKTSVAVLFQFLYDIKDWIKRTRTHVRHILFAEIHENIVMLFSEINLNTEVN